MSIYRAKKQIIEIQKRKLAKSKAKLKLKKVLQKKCATAAAPGEEEREEESEEGKNFTLVYFHYTGLEIKVLSREPNCIFKSYLKVVCIETCTSFGSLLKFEGASGEFKGPQAPGTP